MESFGKRQEVLPRVLSIAFTELFDAFATERRLLKKMLLVAKWISVDGQEF